MNPRPEEKPIISEAYNHFKELFEKKQVDSVLLEHQN